MKKPKKFDLAQYLEPDYTPRHAEMAMQAGKSGLTTFEIMEYLGVSLETFSKWRAEHQDFADALVLGADPADQRVERALFDRAVGYDYIEQKMISTGQAFVKVNLRKHMPPDLNAIKLWLANRGTKLWATESEEPGAGDLRNLTSAQLLERVAGALRTIEGSSERAGVARNGSQQLEDLRKSYRNPRDTN